MNQEKIARLQALARTGGKGTPRRKVMKQHKSTAQDDKKVATTLKKLGTQPIAGVEEVNMFKEDGKVLHFRAPKVQAAVGSNLFAINGHGEDKDLTELVPGILSQLGPESLNQLKKLTETLGLHAGGNANNAAANDDDDVPELVESFDQPE